MSKPAEIFKNVPLGELKAQLEVQGGKLVIIGTKEEATFEGLPDGTQVNVVLNSEVNRMGKRAIQMRDFLRHLNDLWNGKTSEWHLQLGGVGLLKLGVISREPTPQTDSNAVAELEKGA